VSSIVPRFDISTGLSRTTASVWITIAVAGAVARTSRHDVHSHDVHGVLVAGRRRDITVAATRRHLECAEFRLKGGWGVRSC
jgi:hypothetical protein